MLNHYLPAAYISLFSTDIKKPRRKRTIYVGDFSDKQINKSVAGKCAGENHFYDDQIEKFWHLYEPKLPKSIDNLINGSIDIFDWAMVLVPFVASIFVRTRTFNKHMEERLRLLKVPDRFITQETINSDRILEFQRLLAPILAAEWVVSKVKGSTSLITNDIACAPYKNSNGNDYGWAIPLGLTHVLVVIPRAQRRIASFTEDRWIPNIQYSELPVDDLISLNSVLSQLSNRFIFGSDPTVLKRYLLLDNNYVVPEIYTAGFISGIKAMQYELSWFKYINMIHYKLEKILELGLPNIGYVQPFYYRINPPESNPPPFIDPFRIEGNSLYMFLH